MVDSLSFDCATAGVTTANRPERQAICHLATSKKFLSEPRRFIEATRVRQNWFRLAFIATPHSRERNRACFENRVLIGMDDCLLWFAFIILCFVALTVCFRR